MANSVDPDQTAPMGAVCSGSTLFASILNLSVMLGNYLQQTTFEDNIFRWIFFLAALRVKPQTFVTSVAVFTHKATVSSNMYMYYERTSNSSESSTVSHNLVANCN